MTPLLSRPIPVSPTPLPQTASTKKLTTVLSRTVRFSLPSRPYPTFSNIFFFSSIGSGMSSSNNAIPARHRPDAIEPLPRSHPLRSRRAATLQRPVRGIQGDVLAIQPDRAHGCKFLSIFPVGCKTHAHWHWMIALGC